MSEQNVHYETLGLTEASSFEEVQSARKRLVADEDSPQKKETIEAAYDAILMERLRLRQEGKIKVPDRIRFAEKQSKPKVSISSGSGSIENSGPQWFSDLLDQPESSSELLWPSITFAVLIGLSWLMNTESATGAPTALALGIMGAIYFLNQKTRRLWRSLGITSAGVAVGFALGFIIVQIFASQGTALEPNQVSASVASIILVVLWFVTGFLR